MPRDRRLDAESSAFLTQTMLLGNATKFPIALSGIEFARLIGVVYKDTGNLDKLTEACRRVIVPEGDYYQTPLAWFESGTLPLECDHVDLMLQGRQDIADFNTYLGCLSALHKRRKKYARILSAQPIPTMVQVSPRALMEFGGLQADALASWLTWRKWFYDLDNRSAQETGYLFEPILAAALGGEAKGAGARVVRRTEDSSKGRQVDCWKLLPNGDKLAYEFKLRVTDAASRQGRFGEELAFAKDCRASGVRPILLVLDPTPNPTLAALQACFEQEGGEAYVGEAAWEHLEAEAGPTMATFIHRYVRTPIRDVSQFSGELLGLAARRLAGGDVQITVGGHELHIIRAKDAALSDELGDEEET